MPRPSPFQRRVVTVEVSDFLPTSQSENLPCFSCCLSATARNRSFWHPPPIPGIIYWGHFCPTGGLLQRGLMSAHLALAPFSVGLLTYVSWVFPRRFPMDPMWWMLLMKGVNLKSPAGYSRSIQEAASLPIQCSLCTDRGRPREKWGDGIGFEALRQVIKSNTPTHQGMWFPQVPLADMLNFLL